MAEDNEKSGASADARRTYRHSSQVPVQITRRGVEDKPVGMLRDISFTGMAFLSPVRLEMGEEVVVRFPTSKGGFRMLVRVVRVDETAGGFNVGIEYLDIGDESPFELMEKITSL